MQELAPEALGAQVTEEDIAKVIELWTGIPASRVKENELKKLASIEDKLKSRIIGQDEAVKAVSAAIRRSRVQISPRRLSLIHIWWKSVQNGSIWIPTAIT